MPGIFNDWQIKPLGRAVAEYFRTFFQNSLKPDPWPEEIETEIRSADAVPVCHHCFLPLEYETSRWFCNDCGAVVGPYNNILPYLQIFSIGEVARSGVGKESKLSPFTTCGYVVFSYSQFSLLFPLYLFHLFRNIKRRRQLEDGLGIPNNYKKIMRSFIITSIILVISIIVLFWPGMFRTGLAEEHFYEAADINYEGPLYSIPPEELSSEPSVSNVSTQMFYRIEKYRSPDSALAE